MASCCACHVEDFARVRTRREEGFQKLVCTKTRAWLQWSDASETDVQVVLVPSYCPWVNEI